MQHDVGPFDLRETALILGADQRATTKAMSPTFFEELGADFGSLRGHVLIGCFSFDAPWPTWEMHPEGDEFVYLLSGDTDFLVRTAAREERVRVCEPGSYVVVPAGAWHTARPHAPTSMLFVTPGEGTENRETPG